MTLNFTAIDFETANCRRGSPCSVGLVKVRDGQIVDQSSSFIQPPAGFDHFDPYNISVHRITADMVTGAPSWPQVLGWIVRYAGSDTLVCHNAGFDMSVIRDACKATDMPWPSFDFLCTLVLAHRACRLPYYGLPNVAAQYDVEPCQHHQAIDDARCAALIAVGMARKQGAQTLADLAESFGVSIGHMETGCYTSCTRHRSGGHGHTLVRPDVNPDADPNHPFYGRFIVFTGTLDSRNRQMAWDDVVRVGGVPERNVTKRTNVLVIGEIDRAVLAPGRDITEKAAKAFALQGRGQEIEVMTEDDFLRSL
jgi:DNA polymerase III epsilon subunit-like protein